MMKLTIPSKVISQFCSDDEIWPVMKCVYFDADVKKFVATNGHILVVIDSDDFESDKNLIIPVNCFPGQSKKQYSVITRINKSNYEVEFYEPQKYGDDKMIKKKVVEKTCLECDLYPNYKAVIPEISSCKEIPVIAFDPKFFNIIYNLNKFMGFEIDGIRVVFNGETSAMVVEPNVRLDDYSFPIIRYKAIIIPVRISYKKDIDEVLEKRKNEEEFAKF